MNIESLISDRVKNIQPSPIRRFFDLANAMEGTVSLGIGEPDFVTPWHIREAAMASLRAGETAYTPNADDCRACGLCVVACPEDAITLTTLGQNR